MTEDLRITIDDIRAVGHCVAGTRGWFADRDLNFAHFLKHGIAAKDFLATGCAMAQSVVDAKIARMTHG